MTKSTRQKFINASNLTVLYPRTRVPAAGLENLENSEFSEKSLRKLGKYMAFDSERLEKLDFF